MEFQEVVRRRRMVRNYDDRPLPPGVLDTIRSLGVQQVIVLGGPDAVAPAVEAAIAGTGLSTRRVAGATRHEVGHAADEVYGNFSQDPAFRAAYNADVADIRANNTPVDPYYLQAGDAGPEETFAEAFAQTYGGGIDSITPNFLAAFSRTALAIRNKLR